MFEVALDSSSGTKIEICRICEFVWFDAGETQTLQARPLPKTKTAGCLAALGISCTLHRPRIPQAKIGFLWRYFYYFRWLRLPAWFVFVLWILFQIIGAYEQKIGISSVSSFAHLGGAAVGVIAWFLTRKTAGSAQP